MVFRCRCDRLAKMKLPPLPSLRLTRSAARSEKKEVNSRVETTLIAAPPFQGIIGLAIWPRGTANVLGRELKLPPRLDHLANLIAAGNVVRVQPGMALIETTGERRYFVLMAGVGLDAAIVDRTRPRLKKRVGQVAFWYAGLEQVARWKPTEFTVEVGGSNITPRFARSARRRATARPHHHSASATGPP